MTDKELRDTVQRARSASFQAQPAELGFHIHRNAAGEVVDITPVTAEQRRRITEAELLDD